MNGIVTVSLSVNDDDQVVIVTVDADLQRREYAPGQEGYEAVKSSLLTVRPDLACVFASEAQGGM